MVIKHVKAHTVPATCLRCLGPFYIRAWNDHQNRKSMIEGLPFQGSSSFHKVQRPRKCKCMKNQH